MALIDADLRSPAVATMLGMRDGIGLSSLLTGSAPLAEAMTQWSPGLGLRVISSGPAVGNPGHLLGAPRMASLVTALTEHGLTVIIDSPPLTTVADAAALARVVDGALLVARCGRTTSTQLGAAVDELRSLGTSLFGIALNRTPAPRTATAARAGAGGHRRTVRGKRAVPVQIPFGSSAGHAAEGFSETAPPPTRAAPPDTLAASVADLFGQAPQSADDVSLAAASPFPEPPFPEPTMPAPTSPAPTMPGPTIGDVAPRRRSRRRSRRRPPGAAGALADQPARGPPAPPCGGGDPTDPRPHPGRAADQRRDPERGARHLVRCPAHRRDHPQRRRFTACGARGARRG